MMNRLNSQKNILGLISAIIVIVSAACSAIMPQKSDVKFLGNRDTGNLIDLAWSPTGKDIVVSSHNDGTNSSKIYLLDLETQDFRTILESMYGSISATGWSPDGKQIVFNAGNGGRKFQGGIWLYSVDGQTPAQYLTDGELAALSPLGDKVAVFKVMRNNYLWEDISLHLINLESSQDEVIYKMQGKYLQGLSWSPDGKHIVFAVSQDAKPDRVDIFVLDIASGQAEQLTTSGRNISPVWSPNSEWIAYTIENSEGKAELFLYDMNRKCRASLVSAQNPSNPTWSPDGKHIAFIQDVKGIYTLDLPSEDSFLESCR
jgi:Tol biopolymer transport system component